MAKILFTDSSHPLAAEIASLLQQEGHEVILWDKIISTKEEVRELIGVVGVPDALVLSEHAGVNESLDGGNAEHMTEKILQNLLSAFQACKHIGTLMTEKKQGTIIFLSSIFADRTCGGNPAYSITQGAMQMMMKELALHFGNLGLRVNMIKAAPCVAEDAFFESDRISIHYDIETKAPTHLRIEAMDVVSAIDYMISPGARNFNGTSLTLDGGLLNYYGDRSYEPKREVDLP